MIKGITVILYDRKKVGMDAFNKEIYEEIPINVENVLVAPAQEEEVIDKDDLSGRKAIYTLAIPKGDKNDWEDRDVEFFGERYHTIGKPIKGIEDLIPLKWNTKVRVEKYG